MDSDNYEVIYCEDDGEYRVYCGICDNLCIEQFYKNHLKSQTHKNINREREQLNIYFQKNFTYPSMSILCNICDREILEIESDYNSYVATLRKKNDKCLYTKYTIIKNNNLDELDETLSGYISHHNKNFGLYFNNWELEIEVDNILTAYIQTNCRYNTDTNNLKSY